MPDPTPPRLTLGELANRVLATADPAKRHGLVVQLARGARAADQLRAVADLFLAGGPAGRRAFLEWVGRLRGKVPAAVLAHVAPLLSDRTVPPAVRVLAAARVLRSSPDTAGAVRPVVRPLVAGLSGLRRLGRLRQLQHQTDKSRALDALIERRERRVRMDCPRCGVRLRRVAMVEHLWHEHGLLLDGGKVRDPRRVVAELRAAHAATGDPAALDRAALLAGPSDLRAWVAADPPAEDAAPLLAAALDRRAGLCPTCFGELAEPVAPLPPPLGLNRRRLSGDGYVVEVGGADGFRTRTIAVPGRVIESGRDRGGAVGPRGAATLAAGAVLAAAVVLALLVPPRLVNPVALVVRFVLAAAGVYGIVYFRRRPLPRPAESAVDGGWAVLARRLVDRPEAGDGGATRFLTRLCRASIGRGDPVVRVGVLNRVAERAAAGANESAPALELLAAATFLQVDDSARLGSDRAGGVAALAAAGFRDDLPFEYVGYVAECFLGRPPAADPADGDRLRVLLLAAAFAAGLKPRDLIDVWAVAPHLRRAMAVEPPHRLGLFHAVWGMRHTRGWEAVGPAVSAFELARVAPHVSARVLADFPDALLVQRFPDAPDLGPLVVCCRGVALNGFLVADPEAEVGVTKDGRGYEVAFGRHRFVVGAKPPDGFADLVRDWLAYRARVLLPHLDGYLAPGSAEVSGRVMWPYCRRCEVCETVSAVAAGTVGTPVRTPDG